MDKWAEFYKDRIGDGYANYCAERYKPFLREIIKDLPGNADMREEGCGIGTISKILMWSFYNRIDMFDLSQDTYFFALENLRELHYSHGHTLRVDNIFREQHKIVDVAFTHGVLEHFDDAQIRAILLRQKRDARRVVHYVPTDGYAEPSFGDERLLPVRYWIDNFKPTRHIVFNDGCDLAMTWERDK